MHEQDLHCTKESDHVAPSPRGQWILVNGNLPRWFMSRGFTWQIFAPSDVEGRACLDVKALCVLFSAFIQTCFSELHIPHMSRNVILNGSQLLWIMKRRIHSRNLTVIGSILWSHHFSRYIYFTLVMTLKQPIAELWFQCNGLYIEFKNVFSGQISAKCTPH